jgi:hypothetical protein
MTKGGMMPRASALFGKAIGHCNRGPAAKTIVRLNSAAGSPLHLGPGYTQLTQLRFDRARGTP